MKLEVSRDTASLRFQIERNIRLAILTGHFKPGDRLIERELCELLGVSRASIREALRQLEAEGIIEHVRYSGPIVARITVDEARQLYEIREFLERIAVRDFTRNADDQAKRLLAQAFRDLRRLKEEGTILEVVEAAGRFYEVMLDHAGNTVVRQLLRQLYNRIMLLRATSMSAAGRPDRSIPEIGAILDGILAGDGDAAAEAAAIHVRNAGATAMQVLAERDAQEAEAAAQPMRGRNG